MRRDGSFSQNRCVDFGEVETKEKKNLSRLIHTVQHMPCSRYRKDASSLWNLVGELESFQPPDSSTSVNCSKKTARKSFSRKYLDLRLYPSRDRSSSPEFNLKHQNLENKSQTLKSNNIKKNKKTFTNKTDTDRNVEPNTKPPQGTKPVKKTKLNRRNNLKENSLLENGNDTKRNFTEMQASSEPLSLKSKLRANNNNSCRPRIKSDGTNISKQNHLSEPCQREENYLESRLLKSDKRYKYTVLDKIKGFKNDDYIRDKCNLSSSLNVTLGKALSKETLLGNDQASMVKKLTSYWNNLLNNETDDNELSSSHESSDGPLINKSLQDLAKSIFHKARDRQRRISLSRHRSESSVNIMRSSEGTNTCSDVFKSHKENKEQLFQCLSALLSNGDLSIDKHENLLSDTNSVPTNPTLREMCYDKSCGDNTNLQVVKKSKVREIFEPNFDIKVQQTLEVMEKLIRKLRRFSNLSLTSDQISLSHSLRTMLCLMTATVLSSEVQVFDDYLESEVEVEEDISNDILKFKDVVPFTEGLKYNENRRNDHLQLVEVRGVTMRKVQDAMRYLTLCKDYLWTEFLFSPKCYKESLNNPGSYRHPSKSFTFVIEEEIVFENDYDEDECDFENESKDEAVESTMGKVCKSFFDFFLYSLDTLTDFAADIIWHYWPDSFQGFVKIMYHTLVSLLVWWVIMKEMFYK